MDNNLVFEPATTNDLTLLCEPSSDILIIGLDGLRALLAMIKGSWAQGLPVILTAKEVKFIPDNDKLQAIHFEIR